jgi:hypothetical protein
LIGAAALTIGILFVIQRVRISRFTTYSGKIRSVSWRLGGGMDGGYLDYTAENTEKGYVLVIKAQKEGVRRHDIKELSKVRIGKSKPLSPDKEKQILIWSFLFQITTISPDLSYNMRKAAEYLDKQGVYKTTGSERKETR